MNWPMVVSFGSSYMFVVVTGQRELKNRSITRIAASAARRTAL